MKSGQGRRNRRRPTAKKGKISQSVFDVTSRIIIVLLCIYIVSHSISLIFGNKVRNELLSHGKKLVNALAEATIKRTDEAIELFGKKHRENEKMSDNVKNKMFSSEIEKYLENVTTASETVDNVQSLMEDVKAENVAYSISTSRENAVQLTKADNKNTTEKAEEASAKAIIVPKPKLTGIKYTLEKLKSFENTIKKFYTVTSATSIKSSDLNVSKALQMDFKIEGNNNKPQILIYHTHSQEEFADTGSSDNKTIVQVGDYLAKILREQFEYNVLHDKSSYDLVNGKLDRNKAYEQSRQGVSRILKDNPTINLILDIHRDGVDKNVHLITNVNGKKTAQIMFFNGMSRLKGIGDIDYLYNPYLKENLALSLQMKLNAEAYYPKFTRKNYINAYQYNLDLCEKSMLIEVGAQTNTFEEAKNAMEPLAMLIDLTMGK